MELVSTLTKIAPSEGSMRLNLELTNEQMESLKKLQERMGARDMKDLVNNALTMLEWAANETGKGNEIAAVNEEAERYRVLVTPLLQYVAKRERQEPALA
jgi:hypothetical protein